MEKLRYTWKHTRSQNLHIKFKRLNECAKTWNVNQFGNINLRIAQSLKDQEDADSNDSSALVKTKIQADLDELFRKKASMLGQIARTK